MSVRSKRLAGPTQVTNVETNLYTVPAAETALVKQVSVVNNGNLPRLIVLRENFASNGSAWLRRTVGGGDSLQLTGFWVFPPGVQLRAISDDATGVIVSLYGAELEGVAD